MDKKINNVKVAQVATLANNNSDLLKSMFANSLISDCSTYIIGECSPEIQDQLVGMSFENSDGWDYDYLYTLRHIKWEEIDEHKKGITLTPMQAELRELLKRDLARNLYRSTMEELKDADLLPSYLTPDFDMRSEYKEEFKVASADIKRFIKKYF